MPDRDQAPIIRLPTRGGIGREEQILRSVGDWRASLNRLAAGVARSFRRERETEPRSPACANLVRVWSEHASAGRHRDVGPEQLALRHPLGGAPGPRGLRDLPPSDVSVPTFRAEHKVGCDHVDTAFQDGRIRNLTQSPNQRIRLDLGYEPRITSSRQCDPAAARALAICGSSLCPWASTKKV